MDSRLAFSEITLNRLLQEMHHVTMAAGLFLTSLSEVDLELLHISVQRSPNIFDSICLSAITFSKHFLTTFSGNK